MLFIDALELKPGVDLGLILASGDRWEKRNFIAVSECGVIATHDLIDSSEYLLLAEHELPCFTFASEPGFQIGYRKWGIECFGNWKIQL